MGKTTWKQVVYDTADAYREATGTTDKIPIGELADRVRQGGGGAENLDAELTAQEQVVAEQFELLENRALYDIQEVTLNPVPEGSVHEFADFLVSKVTLNPYEGSEGLYVWKKEDSYVFDPVNTVDGTKYIINITNANFDFAEVTIDTFLNISWNVHIAGNSTITGNLKIVKLNGDYVLQWNGAGGIGGGVYDPSKGTITFTNDGSFAQTVATSKFSKEGSVSYVVSNNPTAYPNGGRVEGYWYEIINFVSKIVTWSGGTDAEIADMIKLADSGVIKLTDYWTVGDVRTVELSTGSAQFVLMHAGGYELNEATAGGRTECSFIVGVKNCISTQKMNNSNTNSGSWNNSAGRTWCNNTFRNSIPETLRNIFKQFKVKTAASYNGTTLQTTVDYFTFPAAQEIHGGTANVHVYCNATEFAAMFQYNWYKTKSNRAKTVSDTNLSSANWWSRSPYYNGADSFCMTDTNGDPYRAVASTSMYVSPVGCI